MKRPEFEQRIAQLGTEITLGSHYIARQREIIAELKRNGADTEQASLLLAQFEERQAAYIAELERCRRKLDTMQQLPKRAGRPPRP
jgi:hypothetical protein